MRPRDKRELEQRQQAEAFAPKWKVKPAGLPYGSEHEIELLDEGWEFETFDLEDDRYEYEVTIPLKLIFWGTKKREKLSRTDEVLEILQRAADENASEE